MENGGFIMKKILTSMILITLLISVINLNVCAASVILKIDGEKINYNPEPYIDAKTNRLLVPLRLIAEKMGAVVEWNGQYRLVTIDLRNTTVTIKIGNTFAYVQNIEKPLDQPATIVNGRTFVPVRFVSEALGAKVDWDESQKTVNISIGKIPSGTFIEPQIEVQYSEGDHDPSYFRLILKNHEMYPDDKQFQRKVQIDNYPQLNTFEQPNLVTPNKWDFGRNNDWYYVSSHSETIYELSKYYYATREDMKTLKLTSGMKIDYTVSFKQVSTGIIKEYKGTAILK